MACFCFKTFIIHHILWYNLHSKALWHHRDLHILLSQKTFFWLSLETWAGPQKRNHPKAQISLNCFFASNKVPSAATHSGMFFFARRQKRIWFFFVLCFLQQVLLLPPEITQPNPILRPNWPFPQSNACVFGLCWHCHPPSLNCSHFCHSPRGCCQNGVRTAEGKAFPFASPNWPGQGDNSARMAARHWREEAKRKFCCLFCHFAIPYRFFPSVPIWRTISRYSPIG